MIGETIAEATETTAGTETVSDAKTTLTTAVGETMAAASDTGIGVSIGGTEMSAPAVFCAVMVKEHLRSSVTTYKAQIHVKIIYRHCSLSLVDR